MRIALICLQRRSIEKHLSKSTVGPGMSERLELEREINIKDIEWKTEAPDWTVNVKAVIEVTTPALEPSFVRLLFETNVKEFLVDSHDDLPEWIMNLLADRFRRPLPTNMHD